MLLLDFGQDGRNKLKIHFIEVMLNASFILKSLHQIQTNDR